MLAEKDFELQQPEAVVPEVVHACSYCALVDYGAVAACCALLADCCNMVAEALVEEASVELA